MNSTSFQTKRLVQLAIPVLIAQLTQTLMGFIDIKMAGSVSEVDLAAVALGTSFWLPAILFVQGLLLVFTPIFSHLHGANNVKAIQPLAVQATYIALIGAVLVMLFLTIIPYWFNKMDVEANLFGLTKGYLDGILWGAPAFVLYQVLRGCSEGISYTLPAMIISFLGLVVNIGANTIFIHGYFGMPALGGAGCGVATAIVLWAMFFAMIIYMQLHKRFKDLALFRAFDKPNFTLMFQMVKKGFPVAAALFFEVSLFSVISILLAPLGADVVSGHQIALNFSSIVFMLPLSIGVAVSIRVGYYLGREQPEISALVGKIGLTLAFSLSIITALLTVLLRHDIALIYNDKPEVVLLAGSLMLMAAIYQLSDSIQVVSAGILRGYKDTKSAFYITLVSYWFIGMPLGYILTFTNWITAEPLGAHGFWIGLIAGLTSAAILFSIRLKYVQKRIKEFTFTGI